MTRSELLVALYGADQKKDLLSLFKKDLEEIKGRQSEKYTHLLETIIKYSHAIIFDHSIQTAHNYRQAFMTTAKQTLSIESKEIEKAFSFLNRTEKSLIETALQPKEEDIIVNNEPLECVAYSEIERLKSELDNKTYVLTRGQKEEDKEAYIKIALLALSTGARLKEITETMSVAQEKGRAYFITSEDSKEEGVVLSLDVKTIRGYLKDVQLHFAKSISKNTDIGRGIRKNIKALNVKATDYLRENASKFDLEFCDNLNHLNILYRECLK